LVETDNEATIAFQEAAALESIAWQSLLSNCDASNLSRLMDDADHQRALIIMAETFERDQQLWMLTSVWSTVEQLVSDERTSWTQLQRHHSDVLQRTVSDRLAAEVFNEQQSRNALTSLCIIGCTMIEQAHLLQVQEYADRRLLMLVIDVSVVAAYVHLHEEALRTAIASDMMIQRQEMGRQHIRTIEGLAMRRLIFSMGVEGKQRSGIEHCERMERSHMSALWTCITTVGCQECSQRLVCEEGALLSLRRIFNDELWFIALLYEEEQHRRQIAVQSHVEATSALEGLQRDVLAGRHHHSTRVMLRAFAAPIHYLYQVVPTWVTLSRRTTGGVLRVDFPSALVLRLLKWGTGFTDVWHYSKPEDQSQRRRLWHRARQARHPKYVISYRPISVKCSPILLKRIRRSTKPRYHERRPAVASVTKEIVEKCFKSHMFCRNQHIRQIGRAHV
jgi:hypothetical protein